jgi:zinc/manganese transport system substrate-binding protein
VRRARIGCLAVLAAAAGTGARAAPLRVVATVPDLAYAVREIGGPLVDVTTLLPPEASPHALRVTPALAQRIARAQVLCSVGLDLEAAYLPALVARAGNPLVQRGGKGECEASRTIHVLGAAPTPIDFATGDIHPYGNPHFWLSPPALADSGVEIAAALTRSDRAQSTQYRSGLAKWNAAMKELAADAEKILAPALAAQREAGHPLLMQYHEEFSYLLAQYGLSSFGSLEGKPGAPPSAGRLARVARDAKAAGVKALLAATYDPEGPLARFHALSAIPVVVLPTMIAASGPDASYPALHLRIANAIVAAVTARPPRD